MSEIESSSHWKGLYRIGGAAALVPVVLGLLDIVLSILPAGAAPDPGKGNVLEWFALLQDNSFLGLRGLGLWNIATLILTIPLYLANINVGVIYLMSIASISVYGIVMAGWSSNNKYAMMGGLRSTAQMISYELTLGLTFVAAILLVASSLSRMHLLTCLP